MRRSAAAPRRSAYLFFLEEDLLEIPGEAVGVEGGAGDIADVASGGREGFLGNSWNHGHLLGEDFLDFVEIFLALGLIERLQLQVHQLIHAGLPRRGGGWL
jgi:hypothetical protein